MAAKKTGKTPATVTLKHLAAAVAEEHELAKKQAEAILGDTVGLIVKHLKGGQRIRLGGLGILVVRKRAARMGRNPATGEAIKIKASKRVAFRGRHRRARASGLSMGANRAQGGVDCRVDGRCHLGCCRIPSSHRNAHPPR